MYYNYGNQAFLMTRLLIEGIRYNVQHINTICCHVGTNMYYVLVSIESCKH